MTDNNNNIYPIFDRMLAREDKEELLKQRSVMIWFTGLSGSGKSTIAIALERELHKRRIALPHFGRRQHRSGINNNLGFTEADRIENIRRISRSIQAVCRYGHYNDCGFYQPQQRHP